MRYLFILALLLIAACDSPSLSMRNVPAQRVEIGDLAFQVRVKGDRAEAIRVSQNLFPKRRDVFEAATMAVERASACSVRSLDGDQAIVLARLRCKGEPPPPTALVLVLDPY